VVTVSAAAQIAVEAAVHGRLAFSADHVDRKRVDQSNAVAVF
jgi:hypothetical protein